VLHSLAFFIDQCQGAALVPAADSVTWGTPFRVTSPRFSIKSVSWTLTANDGRLVTAREVRDAEEKMIGLAAEGQNEYEALGGGKEWFIRNPLLGASEEQTKAVHHVLGSKDFVISFKGPAGAGKTELMTEVVSAIESLSGKRVMVLAPSSPSVEVLRSQGFTAADTLQQFQVNSELQNQLKGQVLWVDEAGFLSVRQMLELEEFPLKRNCRLIVTGDTKQHHSVERGDALRILERSGVIAQAALTKIYRQRIPELREAIEDLSKGRTGEGFDSWTSSELSTRSQTTLTACQPSPKSKWIL
jgi:AAA domain